MDVLCFIRFSHLHHPVWILFEWPSTDLWTLNSTGLCPVTSSLSQWHRGWFNPSLFLIQPDLHPSCCSGRMDGWMCWCGEEGEGGGCPYPQMEEDQSHPAVCFPLPYFPLHCFTTSEHVDHWPTAPTCVFPHTHTHTHIRPCVSTC